MLVSTDLGCSQVRSEKCLALGSRQWGDRQLYEELKIKDLIKTPILRWISKLNLQPLRYWEYCRTGERKKYKSWKMGRNVVKMSSEHGYQTHEMTAAVVTCMRHSQDQGNQYPGIDGTGEFQAPCLTQKQSTASRKVRYFFLRVWSMLQ